VYIEKYNALNGEREYTEYQIIRLLELIGAFRERRDS